jgi:ABC-type nickel/cobalt efflux system permease component RcnA
MIRKVRQRFFEIICADLKVIIFLGLVSCLAFGVYASIVVGMTTTLIAGYTLGEMALNLVLLVVAGVLVAAIIYSELNKRRAAAAAKEAERRAAKRAYESALEELEADNSTEHKRRALESGRKYAALSREAHEGDKSVTLFDEVALTNDINARIN